MTRILTLVAFFFVFILLSLKSTYAGTTNELFECKSNIYTTIECFGQKTCKGNSSSPKKSDELRIVGPESTEPFLIGNIGNSKLTRLSESENSVYLAEIVANGNSVLYVWMKQSKRLFMLKAYNLLGDFSTTSLYECKSPK